MAFLTSISLESRQAVKFSGGKLVSEAQQREMGFAWDQVGTKDRVEPGAKHGAVCGHLLTPKTVERGPFAGFLV